MKDKTKKSLKKDAPKITIETPSKAPIKRSELFPFMNYTCEFLFLLIISIALYANTFWNGFVLDDAMSVTNNKFVQQGILGVGKIFSTDSLFGFVGYVNDLQGGRYRPLSLLVFAFEKQFWGNNPHYFHLVNIILWVLTTLVIFNFLRKYIFKDKTDIAFITSLLFIIHPIHTEVVANIKSLDEILSLLFLMSSVTLLFNYLTNKSRNIFLLITSLLLYFIALFSKEYGLTFLFIIPLMIHFFTVIDIKRNLKLIIPFASLFIAYFLIRYSIVGLNNTVSNLLQNNPFLYATPITKLATIMFCLLKYIALLVFPHPLSYDYTYNQIPIVGFGNPFVILSLIIYIGMFVYAVLRLKSKDILAFGILFFMVSIFITSNILIEIGALMGERFLFQPSLGFSIIAGYLIYLGLSKLKRQYRTIGAALIIGLLMILGGYKTIARNAEWKSEYHLYTKDVLSVPNSAIANNNAGVAIINYTDSCKTATHKTENYLLAISYCRKSNKIQRDFFDGYVNAAFGLIRLGRYDEAADELEKLKKLNPNFYKLGNINTYLVNLFSDIAHKDADKGNLNLAIHHMEKAMTLDSTFIGTYNNLGILYCMTKQFPKAIHIYETGLKANPSDMNMLTNLSLAYKSIGAQNKANDINKKIEEINKQATVQK